MHAKYQFWLHLTLIISLIISMSTTTFLSPVAAQEYTTLSVKPPSIVNTDLIPPDSTFNVLIWVDFAFDLYTLEFELKFNPNVLNATSVILLTEETGGLWPVGSDDQWVVPEKRINNDVGYVWYAVAMPAGSERGIGGGNVGVSGPLAIIGFKVVGYGDSLLHLYDTILGYSPGNPYYPGEPMLHLVQDGYFANQIITHDIAVTEVTASPTSVPVGDSVSISVTVKNNGTATETFDVFAYYGTSTRNDNATVTSLSPGAQNTTTFTWDTINVKNIIGVTPGTFTIWAEAPSPWGPLETNPDNNNKTDGIVTVYPRNIAITNVTASPTAVNKTKPVFINVTVKNEGYFATETFNVTTYYNSTPTDTTSISTQTHVTLEPQTSKNLTFAWNTKYVSPKNYTISAKASTIRGEWNQTDNTRTDGTVNVIIPPGWPMASFVITPDPPYHLGDTLEFNSTSIDTNLGGYIATWQWDLNGDDIIDATTENTTYTYTAIGTYNVTLTVEDNDGYGPDSIQKTIDILKTISIISIEVSPDSLTVGESTIISGSVNPKHVGVTVTIKYRLFGATTWSILTTVTTNDNSQYSYNWMTENVGTYEVKASWLGDDITESAASPSEYIMVNKMASTISIAVSEPSITLGSSVTISGAISPARASVTVTIQYKPGVTMITLKTVTTDSDGKYSYTWTPTTVKTFQIKAKWDGDSNTEPAESSITTVTINKMPSTISITVSPTSIIVGESTTLSGSINLTRPGVKVTIWYRIQGTDTWNNLTATQTNATSQYSYTWTPSAFGTFQVKASWPGDASTLQAASDAKTLTVKAPPHASFTYTPSAPVVNETVTFTSNSTDPDGSIQSWDWDFGDGTPHGNTETVTHTYTTAGDFTVTLTVTDNDGLTHTTTKSITVSEATPPPPGSIPLYIILAVGAVIVLIIVIVVFLRRR